MDKHYVVVKQGVQNPDNGKNVEPGSVLDQDHYDAILKRQPLAHRWMNPIEAGKHPALADKKPATPAKEEPAAASPLPATAAAHAQPKAGTATK